MHFVFASLSAGSAYVVAKSKTPPCRKQELSFLNNIRRTYAGYSTLYSKAFQQFELDISHIKTL